MPSPELARLTFTIPPREDRAMTQDEMDRLAGQLFLVADVLSTIGAELVKGEHKRSREIVING